MDKRILSGFILLSAIAYSQDAKQETPPPSTWNFGFEQRIRNEDWNNILDYSDKTDDQRIQVRYRTRLWFKAPLGDNIDFNVGINSETNNWSYPAKNDHLDEVVFDTFNLNIKKLFVKGLSLSVGRQNLTKGEGFIMFEGNPGDGSRAIYFNAADLAYSWKKSKVELIGLMDPKYDRMLPVFNNQHKLLQEYDQNALGTYYTNNDFKKTGIEGYYFYTKEVHDYLAPSNPQFIPDRHISTLGGRVVQKLGSGWSLTGEFAEQWGAQHPDVAISARGGYGYVKKQFTSAWRPYVQAGWWGMSGDNPGTSNTYEGFDPIFARWPKWSELYIYSQVKEKGVAYWTNMKMWQAETGFAPTKMLSARLTYYHMDSFYPYSQGSKAIFGTGTDRGNNFQARLDFNPDKHWKSHILYETQMPGDFYAVGNKGFFLRFEVSYMIQKSIKASDIARAFSGGSGDTK